MTQPKASQAFPLVGLSLGLNSICDGRAMPLPGVLLQALSGSAWPNECLGLFEG
jgi:hypothetical protein